MLSEHPKLDAVLVAVPNYLHGDYVQRALEAGKHVLVEKPMATHPADADRMMQAAGERNLILQVGLQERYATANLQMAELIRQGAIGQLEMVAAHLFRGDWNPAGWKYTDPRTGEKTNWRFLTYTAGGSLLEDGIHQLDVIHWLAGSEPRQIQAQGGNGVYKHRQTIDNAELLIEFSNGIHCQYTLTLFSPGAPDAVDIRLFGSEAAMHLEKQGSTQQIVIERYHSKSEKIEAMALEPEEQSFWKGGRGDLSIETYRQHKAFAHSILTGTPPFANGKIGRDALHICCAGELSLRTRQVIPWENEEGL
jgi:predicted dehydrogenase